MPITPTVPERLELAAARLLGALPSTIQVLLARGSPTTIDGCTLEPELQIILAIHALRGDEWRGTPDRMRQRLDREAVVFGGPTIEVGTVRDLVVDGAAGPLRARHYAPRIDGGAGTGAAPLLVYFHGGGFVFGCIEGHDAACRFLCDRTGSHVLSVAYRLAPEHRFPAATDDAIAAFAWAQRNAAAIGADPARIVVGGDSAGGNLSAVVAQVATARGTPPAGQLLIYPSTDRRTRYPSNALFATGFFLTRASVDWFFEQYGGDADPADPRISPQAATTLAGLPPAVVVTAAFDPLRDEGETYAASLQRAGVPTVTHRLAGSVHGVVNMMGVSRVAVANMTAIAALARELLHGPAAGQGR